MNISLLTILIVASVGQIATATSNVVCYFASWSVYRYGNTKFTVDDVDFNLCTHFIYSFVGINSDGTVRIMDEWTDFGDRIWNTGLIPKVIAKKGKSKAIVAMGGWNEGSLVFSQVVADPNKREVLCQSILKFVKENNFDGFDLDWEYPAQRGGAAHDRENLVLFLNRLYPLLKSNGYLLSIAVTANSNTMNQSYDIKHLSDHMDMINVMAYDLHGSWEDQTGHNAPLFKGSSDPTDNLNVAYAVKSWINSGADPQKINLGVGTYGRSFNLNSAANNQMGAPTGGIPPSGWIPEAGFYSFIEICKNNGTEWTTSWDSEQVVPYAYSGNKWVGYDDVASIRAKTCFAKEMNLGGLMVWTVDTDDFRNICGQGKYPLINSIWSGLRDSTCGATNGVIPQVPTTTQAPTTEEPTTTTPTIEITTEEVTTPDKVTGETTTEKVTTEEVTTEEVATEEVTTEEATTERETTTIEVTTKQTTDQPINESNETEKPVCKEVGQRIRAGCYSYWVCVPGLLNPEPILMNCGGGLQYDSHADTCNYRSVVKCI